MGVDSNMIDRWVHFQPPVCPTFVPLGRSIRCFYGQSQAKQTFLRPAHKRMIIMVNIGGKGGAPGVTRTLDLLIRSQKIGLSSYA